jgi:hypothetical protein
MTIVEERPKIVSEEDKQFCARFWKVMPFFYKNEIIKGAYPGFEKEEVSALKNYIPHVREMYKGLVAKDLLELRENWEYCIKNEIEAPWDVLELFKPQQFFKRDKKEAFVNYLKHKGITDENEIAIAVDSYLSETPPSFDAILEVYWQKHNTDYLLWLDQLLAGIHPSILEEIRSKKSAILIAAMNETELVKVYSACQNAYGKDFDNEMAFIVFHNFKDKEAVKPEVWQSVKNLEDIGGNVLVIHGEVPEYFDTAAVKKVLNDLAYLIYRVKCQELCFFLMDADVYDLTKGIFEAAFKALKQERILAASPEFDYDQKESNFKYPVLKLIFDIRRDLDAYAVKEEIDYNLQMTYGMFTAVIPSYVIEMGGIKPTNYEDGYLTNDLRRYCGGNTDTNEWIFRQGDYPIYPLSMDNHYVYVNSQKEQNNLMLGREAFAHWSDTGEHEKLSGIGREKVESSNLPAEFSAFTEANIVSALNKAWLFIYKFRESEEITITSKEINHSKRLIKVLKKYGIEILDAKVDVVNQSSFNLKTGVGDFVIRKINQIKIIK